mmetsp:Transcript_31551/g.90022  ORF Transcript_31551/g.90022 Transcript_31551/m.90022 type:complete len:213 (+) Transcript_31551:197-835(+)
MPGRLVPRCPAGASASGRSALCREPHDALLEHHGLARVAGAQLPRLDDVLRQHGGAVGEEDRSANRSALEAPAQGQRTQTPVPVDDRAEEEDVLVHCVPVVWASVPQSGLLQQRPLRTKQRDRDGLAANAERQEEHRRYHRRVAHLELRVLCHSTSVPDLPRSVDAQRRGGTAPRVGPDTALIRVWSNPPLTFKVEEDGFLSERAASSVART